MKRRLLLPLLPAALAGCSPAHLLDALVAPGDAERTEGVRYAPGPRGTLDVYRPATANGPRPVVVFLYGGGWRDGEKGIYAFLGRELVKRGLVVVVPDYRVYPEVTFPAFVEDNAAAVAWTLRNVRDIGGNPRSVFVMGHSAGAFNAAMLALDRRYLERHGLSRRALAGVVGLAGPYDFLPITGRDVIPVFPPPFDGPSGQPISYADGTNPPLLLLAGTDDTTVEPRNTEALARRVRERGGPVRSRLYPGVAHIGILLAFTPMFAGKAPAEADVASFVEQQGGKGG